jgi:hypothetical protein
MVAPTCFGITLPSSGSVPTDFWEMLNWGAVDRILCLVTWCVAICIVRSLFLTKLLCAIIFSNLAKGRAHFVRNEYITRIIFVVSGIINYIVMVCISELFYRCATEHPVLKHPYLCYSHRARDRVSNTSGARRAVNNIYNFAATSSESSSHLSKKKTDSVISAIKIMTVIRKPRTKKQVFILRIGSYLSINQTMCNCKCHCLSNN